MWFPNRNLRVQLWRTQAYDLGFPESQPSASKRKLPDNVRGEREDVEHDLNFDEDIDDDPEYNDNTNLPEFLTFNEHKKMKIEILPVNIQQQINDKIISAFPTAITSELGEAEITLNNIYVGLIKSKQKIPNMAVAGNSPDTEMHGLGDMILYSRLVT